MVDWNLKPFTILDLIAIPFSPFSFIFFYLWIILLGQFSNILLCNFHIRSSQIYFQYSVEFLISTGMFLISKKLFVSQMYLILVNIPYLFPWIKYLLSMRKLRYFKAFYSCTVTVWFCVLGYLFWSPFFMLKASLDF